MSNSETRFIVADGRLLALVSAVVFAVTAMAVGGSAESLQWLASRLAVVGFVLVIVGLVIGSESMIGLATAPLLVGAVIGVDAGSGPAWGRSLIIGCLLYLAAELGWMSIEHRSDADRSRSIDLQRAREVATVVVISLAVGLGGATLASLAPTRTLFVRGAVAAAVLITLTGAVRHLTATAPPSQRHNPET